MKRFITAVLMFSVVCASFFGFVASGNADAPGEIRIGVIGPMTGATAFLGEQMKQLIEIVNNEFDESGGINGIPVSFHIEDDNGNSNGAAVAIQKLVDFTDVNAVIGPLFTPTALAVKPIAEANQVPVLLATVSNPGVFSENGYMFSLDPSDEMVIRAHTSYLNNKKGFNKVALLGNYSDATLLEFSYFNQFWLDLGGEVVFEATYNPGSDDFRTELVRIRESGAEAIFIRAIAEEFRSFIRQLVELGLDDIFIATDYQAVQDATIFDFVGDSVDGRMIFTRPSVANEDSAITRAESFMRKYHDTFGVELEAHILMLYDCLYLIAEAIKSGAYEGEDIRDYLYAIDSFPGITGNISFSSVGLAEGGVTLMEYANGRVNRID